MRIIRNFCIFIAISFIAGSAAGKIAGDGILSSVLRGNINFFSFIFSPSQSFIDTYSLLNNSNDYKRLAGYYSYRETGLIDPEFLYERYRIEDSEIIKKTIIWIAEGSFRGEKLVDFYRKIYNISPENIQKTLQVKIGK